MDLISAVVLCGKVISVISVYIKVVERGTNPNVPVPLPMLGNVVRQCSDGRSVAVGDIAVENVIGVFEQNV